MRYFRRLGNTPTFKKYGAVELSPGSAVQSDAELVKYVKERSILSFQHPCCTAAMLPREKGGVVGVDLKVHGAERLGGGLRVADMSVSPLLVGSHTSATAYAVGEKVCLFFPSFFSSSFFGIFLAWGGISVLLVKGNCGVFSRARSSSDGVKGRWSWRVERCNETMLTCVFCHYRRRISSSRSGRREGTN